MAVQRRRKTRQDDFATAKDLFGSQESMWPRTREELIERLRPRKTKDYQVLAMAVCGTPPEGEEPHGITNEWIWSVEKIKSRNIGTYRRIVVSRVVNLAPGSWFASWRGGEGISLEQCPYPCPPEFFQLVPMGDAMWRKEAMALAEYLPPSVLDMGETGIHAEGGVS